MRLLKTAFVITSLVTSALIFSGCGGGGGQNSGPSSSTVTGNLVNSTTESPMAAITVSVQGQSISAVTDSAGNFQLLAVPLGSQTLVFTDSSNDADGTDAITVSGAQTALGAISVVAAGNPPTVPPVLVKSDLAAAARKGDAN